MYQLSDIAVRYGRRTVLEVEALALEDEAVTVLLGHNGSGKSTLMNLLARQLRPDRGTVLLRGRPLDAYGARPFAREIAYLPQRLPEVPGLTVRELCACGRFAWRGALGRWRAEDAAALEQALAETDLAGLAERFVDRLSGGERQRAWTAMLLAQQAPILLLDEPISALDVAHQVEVLALLRRLALEGGRRVIAILHDINLAARFADRILVLKEGRIAFDGSPGQLLVPGLPTALFGTAIDLVAQPGRPLPLAVPV